MSRGLTISVSRTLRTDGTLAYRGITLREKLLASLLGPPRKLMVLVPGDNVDSISVTEVLEGGGSDEPD